MKRSSIVFKVSIFIVIMQLLIMSLLLSFATRDTTAMLENTVLSDLEIVAKDRAEVVEMYIDKCTEYLDSFSRNVVITNVVKDPSPENIKAAQDYVDRYSAGVPNMEGLYVADMNTYVYAHINPDSINKTFRSGDALYQLQRMLERSSTAFCSGLVTAPVTKQHVISSYKAIRDESGKCIGFVGCAFNTDALADVLKELTDNSNQRESYSLINALTTEFIFAEEDQYVGTYCEDSHILDIIDAINRRDMDVDFQYIDGEKVASAYYMVDRNWLFVAAAGVDVINEPTASMSKRLIVLCFAASAVLTVACMAGIKIILKPFNRIETSIDKLTRQDLSADETVEQYKERNDEVGSFARAVDMLREALENQNEIYSELLKVQSIGFLSLACDTDEIILINKEALSMLGISDVQNLEGNMDVLYSKLTEENAEEIRQMIEGLKENNEETTSECKIVRSDAATTYALTHGKCVKLSTGKKVLVFSLTDITEKKALEDDLLVLSETDGLTGINNRRSGESRIKTAISNGERGLLILFDVNKFKNINDTFGHSVGDEVLVQIARTMEKTFRASDVLMRLGGDEFVVYATDIPTETIAKSVIERFLKNIADIDLEHLEGSRVSVSLGAVLCDENAILEDSLENVDSVMYECKKQGGNSYRIFTGIEAI